MKNTESKGHDRTEMRHCMIGLCHKSHNRLGSHVKKSEGMRFRNKALEVSVFLHIPSTVGPGEA